MTVLPGKSGVPLWSVEPKSDDNNEELVSIIWGMNFEECEKESTLVEDTSIVFDETDNTFIEVKPSF